MKNTLCLTLIALLFSLPSQALLTEIGINYSYQKKSFSPTNYYQSDSKSATVSLYFLERFALELSYTEGFYESQESTSSSTNVIQQSTKATGADLIFVLTEQGAKFQPYVKAGTAYITKKKQIRYVNVDTIDIPTKDGFAPSYGAGIKFKLSERFSFKLGYDVLRTTMDDGSVADDSNFKAGISMYL